MHRVQIDKSKFKRIKEILEMNECGKVSIMSPYMNSITFGIEGKSTTVYIKKSISSYIISRVCLENRRIGTMCAILEELKKIAKEEKIGKITIESVQSQEMFNFCCKHGFEKEVLTEFDALGIDTIYGNYVCFI